MPGGSSTPAGAMEALDLNAVRRWAVLARSVLAARRAEIDALNVFPVPDGDTGTNLFLTFDAAIERMLAEDAEPHGVGQLLKHFASSLLWTARGNSGVILSQLVRGLAEGVGDRAVIEAAALAAGLARADERAWQGVTDPKEGTILSVSRAAAQAAMPVVAQGLYAVTSAALEAAQDALERTPEQLEVLARAGVVDAGGAGLVLLLECLERLVAGDDGRVVLGLTSSDRRGRFHVGADVPSVTRPLDADVAHAGEEPGPEYEVMYLLAVDEVDGEVDEDARIATLRSRLRELGDSVLVVGGEGQYNVHAHVADPGAAVEAGIGAGRPHRVRITRLVTEGGAFPLHHDHGSSAAGPAGAGEGRALGGAADPSDPDAAPDSRQGAGRAAEPGDLGVSHTPQPVSTGVVACAAGSGLAELFAQAGATVVHSGPGRRATTGQLIDAIREQHGTGVSGVVVLPNDIDTELAASAAARAVADEGIAASVVRARTAIQGVAAVAVFEPHATLTANVLGMQSAASATRHGAVTIANRVGLTSGGPCQPGDALGIIDGDIVIVGSDQLVVAREVVHRLLSSGGELVTVLVGTPAPAGLIEAIQAEVRAEHFGVEVSVLDGGQPVYSALIGVE